MGYASYSTAEISQLAAGTVYTRKLFLSFLVLQYLTLPHTSIRQNSKKIPWKSLFKLKNIQLMIPVFLLISVVKETSSQ